MPAIGHRAENDAPPAAQQVADAAAGPAVFERLEYGKLCLSTAGRIVPGSEAYPLVRSPGFPKDLEPLCHPATIGFGDELPAGCPEGWLVRVAGGHGAIQLLACRLRRRPEDGERGEHRSFWRGRFLGAAGPLDPWTCFQALRAEPLPALTVEDTRVTWPSVRVERRGMPGADPRLQSFLPEAVVHVVSAVPIGLAPAISPEQLFHWAAALWALIPASLQAVFTAGWGVNPRHAPAINLSFTRGYPPGVAVFDLLEGRWQPPTERERHGGGSQAVRATPWHDSLLTPGRMYLREAFAWRADGRPDLDDGAQLAYLADLAPDSIAAPAGTREAGKPRLLDLRSPWMADRFVRPGVASLDHARLEVLARWLQAPDSPAPEGVCQAATDYFTAGARRQALALSVAAMAAGNPQGERVIWQSLLGDPGSFELLDPTASPAFETRLLLLDALALGNAADALRILATAPPAALEEPLTEEPARRLEECLDGSLEGNGLLPGHAEVLRQPSAPAPYRLWAERRAPELALALAALPGASAVALRSLARQTEDPCARWIADWRQGLPPRQGDLAASAGLATELRSGLARCLLADWQDLSAGRVAERREALLPWLELGRCLDPGTAADPEWRISFEGPGLRLSPDERRELVVAIENGRAPVSLRPRIAAVVLCGWFFYGQDFSISIPGWADIVSNWPPEVRSALAADCRKLGSGTISEEVSAAVEALRLRSDQLEKIIDRHRRTSSAEVMQQIAPLLWEWCGRTDPESDLPPLAADLCREMARGNLPDGEASTDSATLAAFLARQTGFSKTHPDHLARLWVLAERAWQILMLLESAPAVDLLPSLLQLEALVPHRQQLARHLAMKGRDGRRQKRFEIATVDFHSLPYSAKAGKWRDEYGGSILWAAFSSVPFEKQGDLGLALDGYAGSGPAHGRDRIRLAQAYLNHFHREPELRAAVRRVAQGVVARMARECGLRQAEIQRLVRDELAGSGAHRTAAWPEGGAEARAVVRADKGFRIASWFRYFLKEIQDQGGGDVLLAEIG